VRLVGRDLHFISFHAFHSFDPLLKRPWSAYKTSHCSSLPLKFAACEQPAYQALRQFEISHLHCLSPRAHRFHARCASLRATTTSRRPLPGAPPPPRCAPFDIRLLSHGVRPPLPATNSLLLSLNRLQRAPWPQRRAEPDQLHSPPRCPTNRPCRCRYLAAASSAAGRRASPLLSPHAPPPPQQWLSPPLTSTTRPPRPLCRRCGWPHWQPP
jgi:hypothetical protein